MNNYKTIKYNNIKFTSSSKTNIGIKLLKNPN